MARTMTVMTIFRFETIRHVRSFARKPVIIINSKSFKFRKNRIGTLRRAETSPWETCATHVAQYYIWRWNSTRRGERTRPTCTTCDRGGRGEGRRKKNVFLTAVCKIAISFIYFLFTGRTKARAIIYYLKIIQNVVLGHPPPPCARKFRNGIWWTSYST